MRLRVKTAACLIVSALVLAATGATTASARPPECDPEVQQCSGPPEPGPDDDPVDDPGPWVQRKPPTPWEPPQEMTTVDFSAVATEAIRQGLRRPPSGKPWPLPTIPFTSEMAPEPVLVRQVDDNVWAFASFDAGGRPDACSPECAWAPHMRVDSQSGYHQATMTLRPRLDVEFWVPGNANGTIPKPAYRKAEVTATLYVRAYAECRDWENTAGGTLRLMMGTDFVTIDRDTNWLEDLADATFWQGLTTEINGMIGTNLGHAIGAGRFAPIPSAIVKGHGTRN